MASESEFNLWLKVRLESEAFGAVSLVAVKKDGAEELRLDDETLVRYLARSTSADGWFHSDGEIVTLKE